MDSEIRVRFAGEDPVIQGKIVDLLARCFDVWVTRRETLGHRFPFRELSFAAYDEADNVVGHLGIIPFDLCDGKNSLLRMAGIASVGVDPQFRKRGIAGMLCLAAEKWAKENGFDALPLFTALTGVYAKYGWEIQSVNGVTLKNPVPPAAAIWRTGSALSPGETGIIKTLYAATAAFPGKVQRLEGSYPANSWGRLFAREDIRWLISKDAYLMRVDDVTAEAGGDISAAAELASAVSGELFLSPADPLCDELLKRDFSIQKYGFVSPGCWDGEVMMMKKLSSGKFPEQLFIPLPHKF